MGLQGNEEVDRLAKESISDGITKIIAPYYTDVIPLLKNHIFELWREDMDNKSLNKGLWYKTIQYEPFRYPWYESCRLDRASLVIAFRLRSGHIPLNRFAFLMKKVTSPNCAECGTVEDVYHIIMECVRNQTYREYVFNNSVIKNNVGICNSVLAQPDSEVAKSIYKLVTVGLKARSVDNN